MTWTKMEECGGKKKLKVEFEIAGNLKLLPHERDDPWRTETPRELKMLRSKAIHCQIQTPK